MSTEPTEKVEPEVIEPETGVARPIQPFTITDLATMDGEQGLQRVEKAITILKTLRRASIALTHPQDWVLFKADNRVTGYLQDIGVERVWPMWGIEQTNLTDFERTDDKETGDFAISITGDAYCKLTGQTVEGITGTRYSYEEFIVKRKLNRLQVEPEVKKAARRNLDGNQGRELMGLKSVPMEELDEVWQAAGMTWKSSKFCALGRGFGTANERAGGANDKHGIDVQDIPVCDICQTKLVFRAGKKEDGSDAWFGCPTYQKHPNEKVTISLTKLKEQIAKRQKREPGDEG